MNRSALFGFGWRASTAPDSVGRSDRLLGLPDQPLRERVALVAVGAARCALEAAIADHDVRV